MATEQDKAALTLERGKQAAGLGHEEAKSYIAGSANVDKDYEGTANETARMENRQKSEQVTSDYGLARDARK
jgi:hypothetical protein